MLRKIVAATTPAVSLERARERLHILHEDSDQDIERLIEAATNVVEKETGNILQPSTWEISWCYSTWWWPWRTSLDAYPVRSIVSINYLDADGAVQTVDPANYTWNESQELRFSRTWSPPRLYPYSADDTVRIRFTAGYDSTEAPTSDSEFTLPAECETAVLFLVGHWLEHTEHVSTDQQFMVPDAFKMIAGQMRVYR